MLPHMALFAVLFFVLYVNAQSVSISDKTCSSSHECSYTTLQCTTGTCTLTCSGYSSCQNAIVEADNTDTININCQYNNACNDMIIYGAYSSSLTFTSNAYQSNHVTIYANQTLGLQLNCDGKNSCENFDIRADYAESVYLTATYGNAFYDSTLNVSQSSYISIKCSSGSHDYACYNSYWYFPNYGGNTYINCYGTGCQNFGDIYVDNSIESLNVVLNGCNGGCSRISSCVNTWTIHCANTDSSLQYHDTDYFYGDYCTSYSTNDCSCDLMISSVSFQDYTASECVSNNDDNITELQSSSATSSIATIMGAMVGVVCCVFIAMVIVFVILRGQKRRYNYTAPSTGIQPARVVPTAAPVQQPMQMQQPQVVYMQAMPQQQQAQNMQPRIVYVQAAPQNVNAVTPMQPPQQYSANNASAPPVYNATVPSVPSAPGQDAPPAYDNVAPGSDNNEGAVTNY